MFKLELKLQNLTLKEYSLTNGARLKIGRHKMNEIVLDDVAVSRLHASIQINRGKLLLFDQGSKNGTMINGTRVQSAELHNGDIVRIGNKFTIKVHVPSKERQSTITGEQDQVTSALITSAPTIC